MSTIDRPPVRVPVFDARTGYMAREWVIWFDQLRRRIGEGAEDPATADALLLGGALAAAQARIAALEAKSEMPAPVVPAIERDPACPPAPRPTGAPQWMPPPLAPVIQPLDSEGIASSLAARVARLEGSAGRRLSVRALADLTAGQIGDMLYVTGLLGSDEPCFYDGTNWRRCSSLLIAS